MLWRWRWLCYCDHDMWPWWRQWWYVGDGPPLLLTMKLRLRSGNDVKRLADVDGGMDDLSCVYRVSEDGWWHSVCGNDPCLKLNSTRQTDREKYVKVKEGSRRNRVALPVEQPRCQSCRTDCPRSVCTLSCVSSPCLEWSATVMLLLEISTVVFM